MSDQTEDSRDIRIQATRAALLKHEAPVLAVATILCDLEEELQIAYRTIEALEARLHHYANAPGGLRELLRDPAGRREEEPVGRCPATRSPSPWATRFTPISKLWRSMGPRRRATGRRRWPGRSGRTCTPSEAAAP